MTGSDGRIRAAIVYLAAGLGLFLVYLRLSMTSGLNSDSANILLMASDMLHGHLLLHGWFASDVSFYSTEIPQYALLVGIFGLHAQTAHIAAAMTYTLTFLSAVALARAGAPTARAAMVRTLIAAGIMLAPQSGLGVFALDLSVGHIGTSIPLLLIWLLLDSRGVETNPPDPPPATVPPAVPPGRKARWALAARRPAKLASLAAGRWWVPVVTAVLLAWVLVADPIVLIVGIGPLGFAALVRFAQGLAESAGSGSVLARVRAQWYPLSLLAASAAAWVLAWTAEQILHELGAFTVNKLPFYLTPWHALHDNAPAAWKVLEIFGANYAGLSGVQLVLAFLHLASVAVVVAAVAVAAWRFVRRFYWRDGGLELVDMILASAIVVNVALYMLTNASGLAAHEVAIIVPFGAVLAARLLPTVRLRTMRLPRRLTLAGVAVGGLVLAGYTAGLGWELAQPAKPMANIQLANWLEKHHLTYGLSGYWTSSSVTVDSGGKAEVRALMQYTMKKDLWMANELWYQPRAHYADFIVLDSQPGYFTHWEPVALIKKYFGTPARIYHTGPYTIEVWNHNLLPKIP
ncbi:MAG: hypothetical protein JO345_38475 [Streptosporangiaceae bacterium]|nr:hypothetical protein [Streptosporangiaceae bacterium]